MDPNSAEMNTKLELLEFAGRGGEVDADGMALGSWALTRGLKLM